MTPINLHRLDDLAVFMYTAEVEYFSTAARALHLDAETVSKRIARLETAVQAGGERP